MKTEYDLSKLKCRKNPYASKLIQPVKNSIMGDENHFEPRALAKTVADLHYRCDFEGGVISWGEHEDNPHGVNAEARIDATEFLNGLSQKSIDCRSFINKNFGEEALIRFICLVRHSGQ